MPTLVVLGGAGFSRCATPTSSHGRAGQPTTPRKNGAAYRFHKMRTGFSLCVHLLGRGAGTLAQCHLVLWGGTLSPADASSVSSDFVDCTSAGRAARRGS